MFCKRMSSGFIPVVSILKIAIPIAPKIDKIRSKKNDFPSFSILL